MRFTLPEKFVGHLKKGEELQLSSPDAPQERHTARVIEVSSVVDPSSGTIDLLVELVGTRGNLRPGMTANVRVINPQ
jgi:multidrug efflux pump subunit AcrA (membrane-fusion protein)